MTSRIPQKFQPNERRSLQRLVFWAVLLALPARGFLCGQETGSLWKAGETSASFVIRQETNRGPINDPSFSSDEGIPISNIEFPPRLSGVGVRQPYRSVDQAFSDSSRPHSEIVKSQSRTLMLVPPSTYSHDSREWVEMYPTAGRCDWDLFSSSEVTPTSGSPPTVDNPVPVAPKVANHVRIEPVVEHKLDLTPNKVYAKHLKHTEVCGVVVVQSDFPLDEITRLLDEIALLQHDLSQYMAVPAPKEKIELCLFKDEMSYIRFLKEVFPKAPLDRRALYVKEVGKPGTLLVQRTKDFEIDLRHEMTHAVIHASIANVPIWLDEGLAKYFEPAPEERASMNPYFKTIRRNVKFGFAPSLSRLEKLEFIGDMGSREYCESWAWVHFLIHHSPQSHRLLAGYLQLLATLPEQSAGAKKKVEIPSINLYLGDVVKHPREKYLTHFKTWGVVNKDDE